MNTEERLNALEQQITGLQALCLMQTAELSTLLNLLDDTDKVLREASSLSNRQGLNIDKAFVSVRKARIQMILGQLGDKHPELSNKLSHLLDHPGLDGLEFPLGLV